MRAALIALLRQCRNDLTEAAVGLVPEIATVLIALAALPGASLARMSGSGATCFALFADREAAEARRRDRWRAPSRDWWVKAGALLPGPLAGQAGGGGAIERRADRSRETLGARLVLVAELLEQLAGARLRAGVAALAGRAVPGIGIDRRAVDPAALFRKGSPD